MTAAWGLGAATIAVPLAGTLAIALAAGASLPASATSAGSSSVTCSGRSAPAAQTVDGTMLDATQVADAQVIYNVAVSLQLPERAAVIAIATSMQESSLLNQPSGTADSLGLFQQRPSQGWGSPAQIMDSVYASTRFYEALDMVPNWQSLPLTVAAQDVQGSGHPGAYARWLPLATALADSFAGNCATSNTPNASATGTTTIPAGFTQPPGTPPQVVTAISYAAQQLGKPYQWGGTGPDAFDCSGLVMMAYRTGGIVIPRTSQEQWAAGLRVPAGQEQPGDLVFFAGSDGTPQAPGHVGIVIGNGEMIEAYATGFPIGVSTYGQPSSPAGDQVVVGFTRPA